jgi:hypothetical protein|tara:strand:- start:1321 stop:2085 length:765 start_codon:yes stop_codon:yes gene_type:complete
MKLMKLFVFCLLSLPMSLIYSQSILIDFSPISTTFQSRNSNSANTNNSSVSSTDNQILLSSELSLIFQHNDSSLIHGPILYLRHINKVDNSTYEDPVLRNTRVTTSKGFRIGLGYKFGNTVLDIKNMFSVQSFHTIIAGYNPSYTGVITTKFHENELLYLEQSTQYIFPNSYSLEYRYGPLFLYKLNRFQFGIQFNVSLVSYLVHGNSEIVSIQKQFEPYIPQESNSIKNKELNVSFGMGYSIDFHIRYRLKYN